MDSPFCSGVGSLTGGAHISPDRGNIQDMSLFGANHGGNHRAAHVEGGGKVYVQDLKPFFCLHILQKADMGDAGTVHKKIRRSFGLACFCAGKVQYFLCLAGIGKINGKAGGTDVFLPAQGAGIGQVLGSSAADKKEVIPFLGKPYGDGTSNAAGGAGYYSVRIHKKISFF